MPLVYSALQFFAWYSSKLFFRDITVVNAENVPKQGATIIYGNHNNQFVDGILLMAVLKRNISFIAAAKSCKRTFVGPVIRGTGAIPVERPQDIAYKGAGRIIQIKDQIISGRDTKFTTLGVGALLQFSGQQLRVAQVINDEQLRTDSKSMDLEGQHIYKIIPKLDFNEMYNTVWESLKNGNCIGIYPEGGSHDRPELLPLKAGICIMALGAMDKYNIPVKIVPCGFNYYNPQKFRSKAILQFGPVYEVPISLVEIYRKDKKKAISILLQNLQRMLKAVTIEFKQYNELTALFTCRQLYALTGTRQISVKQKLQLNRRFAKGYNLIVQKPQCKEIHKRLLQFSQFVTLTGLPISRQDYFGSRLIDFFKFIFYLQKLLFRSLIALPGLVMMGPTTTLIAYLSQKQRIKCLKGSKVKQYGNDVVGSYKILLSTFLLPLTSAVHSAILYAILKRWTKLENKTILKISLGMFALQPIYALLFVKAYDSFKKSWLKINYLFMRMFKKDIYAEFNKQKREIQKQILTLVDKVGAEIIEDFDKNRVLKKEELHMTQSNLYIFHDEQK